jgi:HemY protein
MAAQSYITDGKPKYAERVLKKAWSVRPHPDIAAAFASVYPDETATARIKRFRQLEKMHPDHPETRMLMAELHIADRDFEAAKVALGTLPETEPTARSLTLLAATERGQGAEDAVVRALLTRAVSAPRGPQWVCENCNTIHDAWAPVCENCQGFDTIAWLVHSDKNKAMPAGTDMLPLFVSANDGASDTAVEQPAETDLVDAETDSASDAGASRE